MNARKAGEILTWILSTKQVDPKQHRFSKEIYQPLFQNGQTALVCIHGRMFPRPIGVPLCEERIVHVGEDRSNTHAFAWPAGDFTYVLVCTDCLTQARGDIAEIPVLVGGTIHLTT